MPDMNSNDLKISKKVLVVSLSRYIPLSIRITVEEVDSKGDHFGTLTRTSDVDQFNPLSTNFEF